MENEKVHRTLEDVVAGRNIMARMWNYVSDSEPVKGRFNSHLPRDADGVTRNHSFLGCRFSWDVVGTFENCDVDGVRIPDGGPYGVRDYLSMASMEGRDHGRWSWSRA